MRDRRRCVLIGHANGDCRAALRERLGHSVGEIIAALYWCQSKPRCALCDLAAAVNTQVKSGGVNAAVVVPQLGGDGWRAGIDPAVVGGVGDGDGGLGALVGLQAELCAPRTIILVDRGLIACIVSSDNLYAIVAARQIGGG